MNRLPLLLFLIGVPFGEARGADLSWLAGSKPAQLSSCFKKNKLPKDVRRAILTIVNDQPDGRHDRIDAGHETLHVAAYLHHHAGRVLRPRCRVAHQSLLDYRAKLGAKVSTRLAKELHFDRDGAALARQSHQERARFWQEHFKISKTRILEAASLMAQRRAKRAGRALVMVLGAGSCADIPLKELLARNNNVVLVDLDQDSLKQCIAMQSTPKQRKHVRTEIRDLSQGVIDQLHQKARAIIKRHAKSNGGVRRARAALRSLFHKQLVPIPQLEGLHRVDLLVSSLLVGQLPVFPMKRIEKLFQGAFHQPLAQSRDMQLAQSAMGDRLFEAHMEALADFASRSRAVVYFASDMFMRPAIYNPADKRTAFGPPSPVFGCCGKPLKDLDDAFRHRPGITILSRSSAVKRPGSDFWVWPQEPPELGKFGMFGRGKKRTRVRRGYIREVDAVILHARE